MARNPSTPDCAIKGCTRAAHKGMLCAKHYELVPLSMIRDCMSDVMQASHDTARRHHRKQLAYVRKALGDGTASPRPSRTYARAFLELHGVTAPPT